MGSPPSASVLAVVVAVLVAVPAHALAQGASAQAETMFREGRALMDAGKYAEACSAFDASQKLDPAVSTQLNRAACREKTGQLATAWGLFVEAERQARGAADDRTRELAKVAHDRSAKLESQLSTLAIRVPRGETVPGLQIMRDSDALDAGAWNRSLPIDGGSYTISARAPGREPWSTKVVIARDHDVKTVEVPALKRSAVAAAPPRPGPQHHSKAAPIVFGVAAAALLGGAVGLELWGRSVYDDAKREFNDAKQQDLWTSANHKRYAAEGLAAGGLACVGIAVWLALHRGGDEAAGAGARNVVVGTMVSPDAAGFVIGGRY